MHLSISGGRNLWRYCTSRPIPEIGGQAECAQYRADTVLPQQPVIFASMISDAASIAHQCVELSRASNSDPFAATAELAWTDALGKRDHGRDDERVGTKTNPMNMHRADARNAGDALYYCHEMGYNH